MDLKFFIGMALGAFMLSGCGLKGPLYMPEADKDKAERQTALQVTSPYHDTASVAVTFSDEEGSYMPFLSMSNLETGK